MKRPMELFMLWMLCFNLFIYSINISIYIYLIDINLISYYLRKHLCMCLLTSLCVVYLYISICNICISICICNICLCNIWACVLIQFMLWYWERYKVWEAGEVQYLGPAPPPMRSRLTTLYLTAVFNIYLQQTFVIISYSSI